MDTDNWKGFTDEEIKRHAHAVKFGSVDESHGKNTEANRPRKSKVSLGEYQIISSNAITEKKLNYKNSCLNDCRRSSVDSPKMEKMPEEKQLYSNSDDFLNVTSSNESSNAENLNDNEKLLEELKNSSTLEEHEKRQRQIQSENARFKAIIAQTLIDRKKRTLADTLKLEKIQEELARLDLDLSHDICMLRKLIEQSTIEYAEAEKKYIRAEKTFVAAKLLLFKAKDKKEKLTEHLCKIIEQNESLKTQRLQDLMEQLEIVGLEDGKQTKATEETNVLNSDLIDPVKVETKEELNS